MHNFKKHRVQNLYDYLENDFIYDKSFVLKTFGTFIDKLKEEDWLYLEDNLNLWASEILERLARVIVEYKSNNLDYKLQNKIYCLAFINCCDKESTYLSGNLPAELGLLPDLDVEILRKVIERFKELLNNNSFVRIASDETIQEKIEFVEEKIRLTLAEKLKITSDTNHGFV